MADVGSSELAERGDDLDGLVFTDRRDLPINQTGPNDEGVQANGLESGSRRTDSFPSLRIAPLLALLVDAGGTASSDRVVAAFSVKESAENARCGCPVGGDSGGPLAWIEEISPRASPAAAAPWPAAGRPADRQSSNQRRTEGGNKKPPLDQHEGTVS